MKQFISFVKKEFYHVFRDSKTLLMLFGLPIVLILLFGFAVTNEIKNARLVICDLAKDPGSARIIEKFAASPLFQLERVVSDPRHIEQAFRRDNLKLAVVIPANFSQDLQHLHQTQLQIIADASDPNTATTLSQYASNIILQYAMESQEAGEIPYRIEPEIRMLYNPELKGATNFVPGIMALVLLLVCVLMTAVSIVREKEMGTMEILLVSPVNPFFVIISKAMPYLALSLINLAVILVLSTTVLGLPIHGSLGLLIAESTLLILCALSLGLLISNNTRSQQAAMMLSMMVMLIPTMLFTGFMFPIENMPVPLQVITHIFPSKWYYIIVKSIMIKGLGFNAIWKETLILAGMTAVLLGVSVRTFKNRLT